MCICWCDKNIYNMVLCEGNNKRKGDFESVYASEQDIESAIAFEYDVKRVGTVCMRLCLNMRVRM